MFVFILSSSSYSSLFVKRDRQIERKTALSILLLYQCQRHPVSSWRLYYLITTRNTNRQSRPSSGQVLRVAKGDKRPVFHSLLTQARGVIGPVLGLEGCLQILRDWCIAARYTLTRIIIFLINICSWRKDVKVNICRKTVAVGIEAVMYVNFKSNSWQGPTDINII